MIAQASNACSESVPDSAHACCESVPESAHISMLPAACFAQTYLPPVTHTATPSVSFARLSHVSDYET
eukprot:375597-Rhodomonas_salina.1